MSSTSVRSAVSRRDLLLLLLGVGGPQSRAEGLGGITRIQKLLFLLEKEELVVPSGDGFTFEAYKAGPYSSKLYDDLELLENLGLIGRNIAAEGTEEEAAEIDLTFECLIGPEQEKDDPTGPAADAYEEHRFYLTGKGLHKVQSLLDDGKYKPLVDSVKKIRSRYAEHSLSDLLYHVYTKYPDMTSESEIKEKVLRRRRP
ncbi:MAG: hypothetical protein C0504_10050 [Candidatus Solibacter sp.]|nr:hypothetical protein [Candidatus Solibacter sp.]